MSQQGLKQFLDSGPQGGPDLNQPVPPQFHQEIEQHLESLMECAELLDEELWTASCELAEDVKDPGTDETATATGEHTADPAAEADEAMESDTEEEEEANVPLLEAGKSSAQEDADTVPPEKEKLEKATAEKTDSTSSSRRVSIKRSMILRPACREGALAAAELMLQQKLEKAKDGERVEVMLRQVKYSQDSIMGEFRDRRTVSQMQRELANGEKSVAAIPKISVVIKDGTVYSADNRRLYSFKHCGMPSNSRLQVLAKKEDHAFTRKFTTPSGGRTLAKRARGKYD